MRGLARAGVVLIALLTSAAAAGAAGGVADPCAGRSDVLGVSRIVEIDTSAGPKFGAQYQDASFLEDGEVVLTFDDGPLRRYTEPVLNALDAQCAKATFFVVGRMAVADPDTLRDTFRRGHTIGVHTWSHKKLSTLSAAKAVEEIELGLSATAAALGQPVAPFFRFPYLAHTRSTIAHLGERQLGIFGIDVDSRDFRSRNPGTVINNVLAQLEVTRKGVILFHDIQPSTAGALATLLTELKSRGYRVVHMVAKGTATTIADYDAKAHKALAQKVVAASRSPLAARSAVWPVTGGDSPDEPPAALVPRPAKRTTRVKPARSSTASAAGETAGEEVLPWLKGTTTDAVPEAMPQRAPRPARQPEPEDPWQLRTMGQ